MKEFFKIKKPEDVYAVIKDFSPVSKEYVTLEEGASRILAEPVFSPEDMPPFDRATMDGYAMRARDTFGASESMPNLIMVAGNVKMGEVASQPASAGQALEITTGGMLPPGANAVVMQEHTERVNNSSIEVMKAVAPGENVIFRGEDFATGTEVLPRGRKLRPQDIGVLAAIGQKQILVYRKPRVAIISTGDEIVSIDQTPSSGKIRDINAPALYAAILENGAIPWYLGIVPDKRDELYEKCIDAIKNAEVLLVSGGSSVGSRDFTASVFQSIPDSQLLIHGVSVSPGKPTILARCGTKALWGLPGHPVSSLIVFWLFIRPLLQRISGVEPSPVFPHVVQARLSRNVPSAQGREDYVRVQLLQSENGLIAVPVFGKSGLISNLARADGVIRIELNTEGLDKDTLVDAYLI